LRIKNRWDNSYGWGKNKGQECIQTKKLSRIDVKKLIIGDSEDRKMANPCCAVKGKRKKIRAPAEKMPSVVNEGEQRGLKKKTRSSIAIER